MAYHDLYLDENTPNLYVSIFSKFQKLVTVSISYGTEFDQANSKQLFYGDLVNESIDFRTGLELHEGIPVKSADQAKSAVVRIEWGGEQGSPYSPLIRESIMEINWRNNTAERSIFG